MQLTLEKRSSFLCRSSSRSSTKRTRFPPPAQPPRCARECLLFMILETNTREYGAVATLVDCYWWQAVLLFVPSGMQRKTYFGTRGGRGGRSWRADGKRPQNPIIIIVRTVAAVSSSVQKQHWDQRLPALERPTWLVAGMEVLSVVAGPKVGDVSGILN